MNDTEIKKLIGAMQEVFPTAEMVARGFENTATKTDVKRLENRMDGMENRMGGMENRMDHLDARMGRMEADLNEIRSHLVYRHEFEDLMARVKYIETKVNIESGK
jgi:archaellum component FlaC